MSRTLETARVALEALRAEHPQRNWRVDADLDAIGRALDALDAALCAATVEGDVPCSYCDGTGEYPGAVVLNPDCDFDGASGDPTDLDDDFSAPEGGNPWQW